MIELKEFISHNISEYISEAGVNTVDKKEVQNWIKTNLEKKGGRFKLGSNDFGGIQISYDGPQLIIDFTKLPKNTTFNITCDHLSIKKPSENFLSLFDHLEIKNTMLMIFNRARGRVASVDYNKLTVGCPKDGKESSIRSICLYNNEDEVYDLSGLAGTNVTELEIYTGCDSDTTYKYNLDGLNIKEINIGVNDEAGAYYQECLVNVEIEGKYKADEVTLYPFYVKGLPSGSFIDKWGFSSMVQKPYKQLNINDYKNLIDIVHDREVQWSPMMKKCFFTDIFYSANISKNEQTELSEYFKIELGNPLNH